MSQMLKSQRDAGRLTIVPRMVREMVYASFMGNTWVASAFVMAFQCQNCFGGSR